MPLWTDLIDPVEATGIARDEQYVIEQARGGSLARYLPNVTVADDRVEFDMTKTGLTDIARYRAFNARPEVGKGPKAKRGTINLPAISRTEPIDERTQKDIKRLPRDRVKRSVEAAIRRNVQAITMRQEWARGQVIRSGALVVDEDNFAINDNYGRDASLTVAAGAGQWWADKTVDRLAALTTWRDLYMSLNDGLAPGRIVFGSQAAATAFISGNQFATNVGSASRPGLESEVRQYVSGAGLPDWEVYERRVSIEGVTTNVLDPKSLYLLPEPGPVANEDGGLLGATYWGLTVSAGYDDWGIQESEQPGIVCGLFWEQKVGSSIEAEGDAVGQPIAANPNASMAVQVLA